MTAEDLQQLNSPNNNEACPVLAVDDAPLDEFFTLVASIAKRLTKGDVPGNNDRVSGVREVSKS